MPDVTLRPSGTLAAVLACAHLAALGALWPLAAPAWALALLALAIAGSFVFFLRRDALLCSPRSIVALEIRDGAKAAFRTRDGAWHEAVIAGSSHVSPQLTVLNLKPEGRRLARHVVILPDSVDAEEYRELRVRLRWTGERAPQN